MKSIELDLSYSQFIFFQKDMENPFNDWDEISIKQGFSYRRDSIGIKTFHEYGKVKILVSNSIDRNEKAIRIIKFPFLVKNNGIEFSTVTESFIYNLKNGNYEVLIQGWTEKDHVDVFHFSFIETDKKTEIEYLRYDPEIEITKNFNLNANPA